MVEKLLNIVGSVRFWLITLAWAAFYAGLVQQNGFNIEVLLTTLAQWVGTVAGVGTLDRFGEKLGAKK